jgi:GGDEF domain-containing protein
MSGRGLSGAAVAVVVLYLPFVLPIDEPSRRVLVDLVMLGCLTFASTVGLRVTRMPSLDRRSRAAWRWLTAALICHSLSVLVFVLAEIASVEMLFALGNVMRLMAIPGLLVGLLSLPMQEQKHTDRYRLTLDIAIVVVAALLVLWYFILGPALSSGNLSPPIIMLAVAAPVGDLVLVFGALMVMSRVAAASLRRPTYLLATGSFSQVGGDVYLSYLNSHGHIALPTSWPMAFWVTGIAQFVLAVIVQQRQAATHRLDDDAPRPVMQISLLPYVAVVLVYAIIARLAAGAGWYPWGGLILGLGLIIGLVLGRQLVVLRENHALVFTDSLTQLANRMRLHEELRRGLQRSNRTGRPITVLLIDMNGFKVVNDTYGHEVGDELLVAFAAILQNSILGSDTAGRLGGDEFAVVLNDCDAPGAMTVTRRIKEAME